MDHTAAGGEHCLSWDQSSARLCLHRSHTHTHTLGRLCLGHMYFDPAEALGQVVVPVAHCSRSYYPYPPSSGHTATVAPPGVTTPGPSNKQTDGSSDDPCPCPPCLLLCCCPPGPISHTGVSRVDGACSHDTDRQAVPAEGALYQDRIKLTVHIRPVSPPAAA